MRYIGQIFFFLVLMAHFAFSGTTGKIAGVVTDAKSGEPLPGVNVVIDGTLMGAATDIDGYYVILNIPPGTYSLKIINVGFHTEIFQNVRVSIDQTTTIDAKLQEESLEIEGAITVVAKRPVVEKDVAASRANIPAAEVQSLPIATVSDVVGLQAGIEETSTGISIRGGGTDEVAFVVDGVTMRNERDNTPYTGLSLTSVEEIQVQSGGFSAEFGNIRSGIVNVVTKEGSRNSYNLSVIARYKPAQNKFFGESINSKNAFWIRPFVDDAVAWTGTDNGAWDEWTMRQYPEFVGWNQISEETLQDDNPANDLTPAGAQRLFLFQHRKKTDISKPDYDIDMSFGGPAPFLSQDLGNLRFQTSYRSSRSMYILPLSEDAYRDYNWQFKLTSDLSSSQKLILDATLGKVTGTTSSRSGGNFISSSNGTQSIGSLIFANGYQIADQMDRVSYIDSRLFSEMYWNPTRQTFTSIGLKYSNALTAKTFIEASLSRFSVKYDTYIGAARDTSKIYRFGNSYYVDEAPYGFYPDPSSGIDGMRMSVGFSNSRDSSFIATYEGKFNITSQVNRYNNVKAGVEFVVSNSKINYAIYDAYLQSSNSHTKWNRTPVRGGLFVQDKLEFEGMIATLGLRFDYFDAGGDWYSGYNPYDPAFAAANAAYTDSLLNEKPTKSILTLSPRLAIAFPISVNSKLYFNYGHFRQLPTPENIFLLRRNGQTQSVTFLANPNNPLPKTVAYELGYEHNLFDEFLFRVAGYYKDVSDQPRSVTYNSIDGNVSYTTTEPNSYEDIRGFELTLNKNRGNWVRGFLNYTYMVSTSGNFGFRYSYEHPVKQREEAISASNYTQNKPVARPYARANIDVFTPQDYGPQLMSIYPLEDIRMNILANWKSGFYFDWFGGGSTPPGLANNVQWKDSYNMDLRFSKKLTFGKTNIEFFVDINNVFNFKHLSTYGFYDNEDYLYYMKSLHYPSNTKGIEQFGYINIPGDDKPGDYRPSGVKFVPIEAYQNIADVTNPQLRPLYYEATTGKYYQYNANNGELESADPSYVKKVLDDKAYIDMPNQSYFNFLNPRNVFWGVKFSIDF